MKITISGVAGEGKTTIGIAIADFLRCQGFCDVVFQDHDIAALRADHKERLRGLANSGRAHIEIATRPTQRQTTALPNARKLQNDLALLQEGKGQP